MSTKDKFRQILLGMALGAGLLMGVPMRPDEIQELLAQTNQPRMVHVLREESDQGDDPIDVEAD
jgi:hypothetical protein